MRRPLAPAFALLMALLVALAGVGHTKARYGVHDAVSMVICTGYGLVLITLDADGNEVEQSLPCPDCLLSLSLTPPLAATTRPESLAQTMSVSRAPLRPATGPAGLWLQSRAPPALV